MGVASTTPEAQIDALNAAFRTHWLAASEDAARIAWDTLPFNTDDVPDFVRFGFQHASGEHAALGAGASRYMRRFGIISAVIYVRMGEDPARRHALTEIVLEFLEIVDVAGFSIEDPGASDEGVVEGWNQVNCTASAHYDLTRNTA